MRYNMIIGSEPAPNSMQEVYDMPPGGRLGPGYLTDEEKIGRAHV